MHSARPRRLDPAHTRATLLRASHEHGEGLARVLHELPLDRGWRLWRIDPYDHTFFDQREAAAALGEIDRLLALCVDEEQRAAAVDLERMLGACAATSGGWLWFVGD
nr:hypothetical protein [Kitasatospora sp. SID7827]